jgi:tRNA-uridine 2-sulfurtransferase
MSTINLKVAVAMSGGVDSSLAAAFLKHKGYDVIGITHQIWPGERQSFGGCCGLDAIDSARSVANALEIPYYVLDLRDDFNREVIARFCGDYETGRTPNPCVICNKHIRFRIMLDKILKMGIGLMATGHYARVYQDGSGYHLLKGIDPAKDQSYFLYTLGQDELSHLLLPIGAFRKSEVRKLAAGMGLPSAARKDSQDICFITGDYRCFIRDRVKLQPGDIFDTGGNIIGRHEGLALYTVGQRHGLGLASNEPLYVTGLDAINNRVAVGKRRDLFTGRLVAGQLNWISGNPPIYDADITAKIRYKSNESKCRISLINTRLMVEFEKLQMAVTPGQSIVFYRGEEVLGGGIIEE